MFLFFWMLVNAINPVFNCTTEENLKTAIEKLGYKVETLPANKETGKSN